MRQRWIVLIIALFLTAPFSDKAFAQPNWPEIKNNATFNIPDPSYHEPYLQPVNVSGWEDGLYITRDGKHLYSTYLPVDAFSWLYDFILDPECFDFKPYFRPPLLDIDTVTNIFDCPNFLHSDIIISSRSDSSDEFSAWSSSNMQTSFSFDGGLSGVLLNPETFDVLVYTMDGVGTQSTDIMFKRNASVDPDTSGAKALFSTPGKEDNPHIERLSDSTLLIFFDRDRFIYYSLSYDNGESWETPVLVTNVLNDQAPYDVQPHLWNDGTNWWMYFCADNENNVRCIYKSRQMVADDWNSWGPKELVIEPEGISNGSGAIYGVGEPTLTEWGDISFVVVYGNPGLEDTTDVFDCDPWYLPKKTPVITGEIGENEDTKLVQIYPNPATEFLTIELPAGLNKPLEIEITNSLGKVVRTLNVLSTQKIAIANLPEGVYVIQVNKKKSKAIRFIKK